MSKFKIYRADSSDPKSTGRLNKRLYIAYTVIFFILLFTINIYYQIKDKKSSLIIYFLILSVLILIIAFVIYKMKKQLNALKTIGTLEFTKTSIKKEIGDFTTTYSYNAILKIEVQKYLRDLSITSNNNGSLTYILKITNKDSSQDNFIVSNRSSDFRQKIGIIDTLKTVKSMTGLNTILNDN